MVHISSLPDLGVLKMFEKLDLENLHRAGQVCRRWRTLRFVAGKERSSLDIYLPIVFKDQEQFGIYYQDLVKIYTDSSHELLINQFPNVRELTVKEGSNEKTENIIYLTELLTNPKWNSKLVSLKLVGFLDENTNLQAACHRLVEAINSLSSLKHLVLVDSFIFSSLLPPLTILPQLKSLTIASEFSTFYGQNLIDLVNFLVRLDPKQLESLKTIKLDVEIDMRYDQLSKLLKMHPQIALKVTCLRFLNDIGYKKWLFHRYCEFFSSSLLEAKFYCNFAGSWFPTQFNSLAKLLELRELEITLRSRDFPQDPGYVGMQDPDLQIMPMSKLDKLSVVFRTSAGYFPLNFFTRLSVSHTFPNLTHLFIDYSFQESCFVCDAELDQLSEAQFRACIHHLIGHFKLCKRLQMIEVEFYPRFQIPVQDSKAKDRPKNSGIKPNFCIIRAPFDRIETAFW